MARAAIAVQPAPIALDDLDRMMELGTGPKVIVVRQSAIESVAQRMGRTNIHAVRIHAPHSARELIEKVRRAAGETVIVWGLEHFGDEEWKHLDRCRDGLRRDPPVLILLEEATAKQLDQHAPNLKSVLSATFRRLEGGPSASQRRDEDAQRQFDALCEKWLRNIRATSSLSRMVEDPAYREIIAMGERAIAPILRDLSDSPKPWGLALHEITQARPVPLEHDGNMKEMAQDWLSWARDQGYRW